MILESLFSAFSYNLYSILYQIILSVPLEYFQSLNIFRHLHHLCTPRHHHLAPVLLQ